MVAFPPFLYFNILILKIAIKNIIFGVIVLISFVVTPSDFKTNIVDKSNKISKIETLVSQYCEGFKKGYKEAFEVSGSVAPC